MKLGSLLALLLLSLVCVAHLLRLVFGTTVSVGDLAIPMWASVVGVAVPGLVVFLLWRERRG